MPLLLGPVLRLMGATQAQWMLSAMVVVDDGQPPLFNVNVAAGATVPVSTNLLTNGRRSIWRFVWSEPLAAQPRTATYQIGTASHAIALPAAGQSPRIAYCSCNGFSDPSLLKKVADKNANWKRLMQLHRGDTVKFIPATPFNLLVMGGDQVYADEMFATVPSLRAWAERSESHRARDPFTPAMTNDADGFYFDLYMKRWSQPEMAAVLAEIPTLMMWDDHDIFDGYGSYSDALNGSFVHRGLFASAAKHFRAFQLHSAPGEPAGYVSADSAPFDPTKNNYSHVVRAGRIVFGVLDTRSERSNDQIMSDVSWSRFYAMLEGAVADGGNGSAVEHLYLIASVPVMYPGFGLLESALGFLPGRQELEDDLRDHWTARPHRAERIRLVNRLLLLAKQKRCRVTILSGDVHVAALGLIQSRRGPDLDDESQTINQLVSSGIVHPAPAGVVQYFLSAVGQFEEEIDRDVVGRMLEIPTANRRFLAARNFLTLNPDDRGRVWAEWWVEGEARSFTKVIQPCA